MLSATKKSQARVSILCVEQPQAKFADKDVCIEFVKSLLRMHVGRIQGLFVRILFPELLFLCFAHDLAVEDNMSKVEFVNRIKIKMEPQT